MFSNLKLFYKRKVFLKIIKIIFIKTMLQNNIGYLFWFVKMHLVNLGGDTSVPTYYILFNL